MGVTNDLQVLGWSSKYDSPFLAPSNPAEFWVSFVLSGRRNQGGHGGGARFVAAVGFVLRLVKCPGHSWKGNVATVQVVEVPTSSLKCLHIFWRNHMKKMHHWLIIIGEWMQTSRNLQNLFIAKMQSKLFLTSLRISEWTLQKRGVNDSVFFAGFFWISKPPPVTWDPGWFLGMLKFQASCRFWFHTSHEKNSISCVI